MNPLSPEDQAALDDHLRQAARILKRNTETDKLQDFESIEVELRDQLLQTVAPTLADVFLPQIQSQPPSAD